MYKPINDLRTRLRHTDQFANAHASFGTETHLQTAYMLHATNLERLLTLEYVRLGHEGAFTPFLQRPSLREKCETVVRVLSKRAFLSDAVTKDRLAILMHTLGVVKHGLCPHIERLEEQLTWVRSAVADLYQHYFNEPLNELPPAA